MRRLANPSNPAVLQSAGLHRLLGKLNCTRQSACKTKCTCICSAFSFRPDGVSYTHAQECCSVSARLHTRRLKPCCFSPQLPWTHSKLARWIAFESCATTCLPDHVRHTAYCAAQFTSGFRSVKAGCRAHFWCRARGLLLPARTVINAAGSSFARSLMVFGPLRGQVLSGRPSDFAQSE